MPVTQSNNSGSIAVLTSGGLDSSVLLYDLSQTQTVFPIYVQQGLAWETEEYGSLENYISAIQNDSIMPITKLRMPVEEIYGRHWSVTGDNIPSANDPDEKVYLPGRNIFLLTAAGIWCVTHGVTEIALGSLLGNPFPDATPEFFNNFAQILSTATSSKINIITPYRGMTKATLISQFKKLPLHLTLTCNDPHKGNHCGVCNKCHERQISFSLSNITDRTYYEK